MKIDLYTKIVLTVIAFILLASWLKPLISPDAAQATSGGKFAHIQVSAISGGIVFFDTRTGDLWVYQPEKAPQKRTITELGKPWLLDQ